MIKRVIIVLCLSVLLSFVPGTPGHALDPKALVEAAQNYWRGKASVAVVRMTVHRPDWERSMTIKAWTKGIADSIFVIIAPPKDKGNGTLKKARQMWMFNPKVNRVMKLPPSMMSQAWQGSDFSNNDLSKTDSVVVDYLHTITGTETHQGKKVFLVKALPKPDAPVVWGMIRLKIREDHILLSQEYYDEDMVLVKAMTGSEIQMLGGRIFPKVWKMQKAERPEEYTLLTYESLEFKDDLPERLFTVSTLKNPDRWR